MGTAARPPVSKGQVLLLPALVVLLLAPAVVCGSSTDADRKLVERWRARLIELEVLQADSRVSLSEGSLGDLGRVAFVFEQLRDVPRKLLDRNDKELVYSAVLGQPPDEFERNLPGTPSPASPISSTNSATGSSRTCNPGASLRLRSLPKRTWAPWAKRPLSGNSSARSGKGNSSTPNRTNWPRIP